MGDYNKVYERCKRCGHTSEDVFIGKKNCAVCKGVSKKEAAKWKAERTLKEKIGREADTRLRDWADAQSAHAAAEASPYLTVTAAAGPDERKECCRTEEERTYNSGVCYQCRMTKEKELTALVKGEYGWWRSD